MDLLENEVLDEKTKKSKMIMKIIIICIVLLLLLSIGLIFMIYNLQASQLKLTIDGEPISAVQSDMFLSEDDTIYISIKDFAKLVGYEAYNGDHTSEETTKGYIKNGYEEASYTLNSNKLYKTLLSTEEGEYFDLEKPVKMFNEKLYISLEGTKIATNCSISYNQKNNHFNVYTVETLAKTYASTYTNLAISDDKANYSNKKALLYNMLVVKNANNEYGVDIIKTEVVKGKSTTKVVELIGKKYSSIKFIESTKEFIVTTADRKVGILSSTGETKIQPYYDEIKQIDEESKLYVVKNNNKYGVINENGNTIIHLEYDKVGLDVSQFKNNFENSNISKNQYILFDNCIPVQSGQMWGIYDKSGNIIVPIEYNSLGCIVSTQSSQSKKNVLIVPDYEGIIIEKDSKYGVVSSSGRQLVPIILDEVYMITSLGKNTYYMTYNGTDMNLIDWLKDKNVQIPQNVQTENANVIETENTELTNNSGNYIDPGVLVH